MGKPWVGNGTWHFQYVANQRAICTWILVLSAKDWFVATDISRINVVNPMPLESWRIYGQFCWYWAWSMALRLPHWHEVELIVNYQESGWNDSNLNKRIFDGQTTIRIMAYSTGSRTKLPWPWAVPGNGQGNGSMSDHPQERWEKYSRSPSVDEDGTEWFAYGLGVSRWAGWVCLTVNSNDHRPSPFSHCFGQSRYVSTMTAKCLYRLTWDLGTNQILIFVGMHWWLIHVIYTSTCTMWAPGPPGYFSWLTKTPWIHMNTI